ncbi:MAG: hypothetical protein HQ551_05035 [Desulfobacteraceae bacterium]|nr:hypothetical protein [Desulfobacteraceae bacterium]
MARKKKTKNTQVEDYRHEDAKRRNIPPAKLAACGQTSEAVEQNIENNHVS